MPPWERLAVALLLLLFALVGVNNIRHGAFAGQDFSFHVGCTNHLLGRPGDWFAQDTTNRPLIYWIAIDGIWLTGNRAPFEFAAYVFLLGNTGALWLVHDTARRFIFSSALRLAALTLIAFLPPTLITTVVFAADAMTMPLVALLAWSLVRWSETARDRGSVAFAALAGVALVVGNFTKATFLVLPAGVAAIAWVAWRWQIASKRRALTLLLLGSLAPALMGGGLHVASRAALSTQPPWHRFDWRGTGEMTWRSLLLPRAGDVRIFRAPHYWETEIRGSEKILPLLQANHYSYPALLHLGTFTDVLNFSHGGTRHSSEPRGARQQRCAEWAVRLGLLFSLPGAIAVAVLLARLLRASIAGHAHVRLPTAIWLVLALNWFAPLVLALPFVQHAYDWGYWLPRLVMPALWGFGLCLFAVVDEFAVTRPRVTFAIVVAVGVQSLLQISSIWY